MANLRIIRIAVPLLVILPLLWLMVGCVYIPWFEQATSSAKRDFRDLSGKSPADPITDGRITKEQVLGLLGPPGAVSHNGRVIAYTMTTRHGVWIEPLCLHVTSGGEHLHALGLRFNADGVLEHHHFATVDIEPELVAGMEGPIGFFNAVARQQAFQDIDFDNGVVHPSRYRGAPPSSEIGAREDFSVASKEPYPLP
jgi:hypothetical protein